MIVDIAIYRDGVRMSLDCDLADLPGARSRVRDEHDFIWIGLHDPTPPEMAAVASAFGLHQLAVEDALKAHQRPKLESYGDSLFMVLKTLWYVDAQDAVETGEINLFAGRDFVVTVRHGAGSELHQTRIALERRETVLSHGPSAVLYGVCDRVVDGYEEVAAALEVDVDEVEDSVFSPARSDDSPRIYVLKRELSEVRRAVLPLREPIGRLISGNVPLLEAGAEPFFRDVADHLARVADTVDNLDALLSSAFSAQLTRISVQQSEDMRKITAAVGIAVVPTLITGLYGMNFDRMPELHWTFGYPFALFLMVGGSGLLYWLFKRSGWL